MSGIKTGEAGKGYHNVRRGKGKKHADEEVAATRSYTPVEVSIGHREHIGYGGETDGEFRLTLSVRERLARAREETVRRSRAERRRRLVGGR